METNTTTTTESITIKDYVPYLNDINSNLTFLNGLLILLIVYIAIKDISRFIKNFITGGMV